jgi:hypothetical protein
LASEANHIELHGPGGVGKSYMLHHIAQGHDDVRSIYINLANSTDRDEILVEVMRQLTGTQPQTPVEYRDFANAIEKLHKPETGLPYNHFVFLFDSARDEDKHRTFIKWLISQDGLINNEELLTSLDYLDIDIEKDVKLQVIIATRKPIVENLIEDYHDNFQVGYFGIQHLALEPNPKNDAVHLMLTELADYHGRRVRKKLKKDISKIYYITGGHPRCIQSVLFAIADVSFLPMQANWIGFFNQQVLPTVEEEMLAQIPAELRPAFEILSVFRCFDKPLLNTLLEGKHISSPLVGQPIAVQARDLRNRLVETALVNEPDRDETMYTMNFTIRRVLELNMSYNDQSRHQEINKIALDIFSERLEHPERLADKVQSAGRFIDALIEIIYHFLRVLDVDPEVNSRSVYARTKTKLNALLQLLLDTVDEDDLPRLRAYWKADKELQETAERVTGGPACYRNLLHHINGFISERMK